MRRRAESPPDGLAQPVAVTFDCWDTLICESDWEVTHGLRVEAVRRNALAAGAEISSEGARQALDAAWHVHAEHWARSVATRPEQIGRWALEQLDIEVSESAAMRLGHELAEASPSSGIRILEGAGETLERLARAGVRRALVSDTGFTPGRVVRRFLAQAGLLELLEVQIFSDEAGATKPHPSLFSAALTPLDTDPAHAIHVGDMRRTDVAGARSMGMKTVRLRSHHDDQSAHPEADFVADSHPHLCEILDLS